MAKVSIQETTIILQIMEESHRDGLNIQQTLRRLYNIFSKRGKPEIIDRMRARILEGGSMAGAFTDILPKNLVEAIASGERTGHLDVIFGEIRKVYELKQILNEKLKKATIYPVIVLTILFIIMSASLIVLLPKIELAFKSLDARKIPAATKFVFSLSKTVRENIFWYFIGNIGAIGFLYYFFKRNFSLLYKIPIISGIMTHQENATAFLLLSVFQRSGVHYKKAMDYVRQSLDGPLYVILTAASKHLEAGMQLHQAFERAGASDDVCVYLEIGNASGRPEEGFVKLSSMETEELEKLSSKLFASINVLLLAVVAGTVLGFFSVTILPIYDMIGSM